MAVERRKSYRVAWNMEATITAGRAPPLRCTVSDLSNKGAKVTCANTDLVPDEFVLDLAPGGTLLPRSCRVVWRAERELGVQFTYPESRATDVTTESRRESVVLP